VTRRLLTDALRDARHGLRLLLRTPTFTFVAVAALAVGIGANLTIFGFVNALLLRPLPAAEPGRLVRSDLGGPNVFENYVIYDDYVDYRDRNQTLSHLSLFSAGGLFPLRIGTRPAEAIQVMPVTGNFFETLGVGAALGRVFTAADDQPGAGAVVLSYEGWTKHFGADPQIVGQTVLIGGVPFSVVGVTGPEFTGTVPLLIPRMYATWKAIAFPPPPPPLPDKPSGFMIGRLRPGSTVSMAQADFARIASQLRVERNRPVSIAVYPAKVSLPGMQRAFSLFAALFMMIVGAVLWAACSNVALLQLVRSTARRKEMAIRLAIGATRLQLVRQLLVENLMLAVLAGLVGAALAVFTARWLTQIPLPVPMPIGLTFDFDWRVAVFAVTLSSLATGLSELTAALDARRADAVGVLRQEANVPRFARHNLIGTQVGLTTALLVIAVALTQSLTRPPDRALDANGVVMANISLPPAQYPNDQAHSFFERLLRAAESAPGATAATLVETIPLAINRPLSSMELVVEERIDVPDERVPSPRVLVNHVSRGHFRTLGIALVQGRDFSAQDDERAPHVVIVNETTARRFWSGGWSVGKRLRLGGESVAVIGVARDSKYESVTEEPKAMVYAPMAQARGLFDATLLLKASGDPRTAFPLVRTLVADLDPNLVVTNVNTFDDRLGLALLPNRAAAATSGILGVIALGLGAIGTYSVMAFLVVQRRREIGIRLALGALPHAVVGMITRQGLRSTAVGLAVGTGAGFGALRLLQSVVVGVTANDPAPVLVVPSLLAVISYLACVVPARRAGRENTLAVLRE